MKNYIQNIVVFLFQVHDVLQIQLGTSSYPVEFF
jgi:hypothetical protein